MAPADLDGAEVLDGALPGSPARDAVHDRVAVRPPVVPLRVLVLGKPETHFIRQNRPFIFSTENDSQHLIVRVHESEKDVLVINAAVFRVSIF